MAGLVDFDFTPEKELGDRDIDIGYKWPSIESIYPGATIESLVKFIKEKKKSFIRPPEKQSSHKLNDDQQVFLNFVSAQCQPETKQFTALLHGRAGNGKSFRRADKRFLFFFNKLY